MDITSLPGPVPATPTRQPEPDRALRDKAEAFEAIFLAEMLKHGGINATPASAGGGAGEDAFASFLTDEYARLLAARGGLGLADQIFAALQATENP